MKKEEHYVLGENQEDERDGMTEEPSKQSITNVETVHGFWLGSKAWTEPDYRPSDVRCTGDMTLI